ncbi:hypothetical protein Tco_0019194 [Tanacetum coccineum]
MHSNGMTCFNRLESHLRSLYQNSFVHVERPKLVEMAFHRFIGEEHQIFRKKMLHNLDQLRMQFERKNIHAVNVTSLARLNSILPENFKVYKGCEPETYRSNLLKYLNIFAKCIDKRILKYCELWMKESEVKAIKETEKLLNKAIPHEHEIEKSFKLQSKDVQINPVQAVDANLVVTKSSGIESENNSTDNALNKLVNETQMQMQVGKVDMGKALDMGVTESSGTKSNKQDISSISENDTTHVMDADIRPVNDQEPLAEVQLTAQHNVLANEQQHTDQFEPIYDTYLLEEVDSNISPDSTNMRNNKGKTDQDDEQYHVKSLLPASLIDQPTTD